MKFAFNILDWHARAPGLSDADQWQAWSQGLHAIYPAAPQAKLTDLPMMTARRLSSGSKLAVDCGLAMVRKHAIDAVVYTSRHGELERNYRLLHALATGQDVSPTDFAMSVHNSAVGNLTIAARQPIVSSSLSAGMDTFQQGLCEVLSLLHAGYTRVLLVDFDGTLPDFYRSALPAQMPTWPYAMALVIEAGDALRCETESVRCPDEPSLPQSLQFLRHFLRHDEQFAVPGERLLWRWTRA
ncbi:beta-ketoacyl synthase chain length factor [Leclercia adecarboxylata]|uniref:Beta-ketoacyl synthase chain length factor n=1 Tax=Leclercia adecarboxylata TaxID=83655 RepID=A0A9X3YEF9_9ENTR|nr:MULTISPECIES: beta-ketoacyl synthase chain length factor [Leclercia]MBD1402165.1 beta-ketoacyl synthase chain length factor [Leclercia adecarboxylata]MDC6623510.1 beta-ketoacyl synthase chain length factor [Leclercia adecarboxylata]MDC6634598.1 beta-ketoacyl synthase chain length factor [Leclercia adecarboxylata]MDC6640731.1 beta-ketoacyl synthase chain length factor [Leclercia adecarboxylata]MDC6651580.1 beta-ketoacyl synthase chain length factor [Leclercia adecarboxylata]